MFRKYRNAVKPVDEPQRQSRSPTAPSSPEHGQSASIEDHFAALSMHTGESTQHHQSTPSYNHGQSSHSRYSSTNTRYAHERNAENDVEDDHWHQHALDDASSSSHLAPPSHHNAYSHRDIRLTDQDKLDEAERIGRKERGASRVTQRAVQQRMWGGFQY